ncbi:MAG: DsbA family protein [Pelagibacteraceae bacterium]
MIKKFLIIFILTLFLNNPLLSNEKTKLTLGNIDAKVTVKVFSSLTCPHCASFHNKIFPELKKEYIDTNKVKFEHHGFPLDLAALNAEKVLRSVTEKEKQFEFLKIIYEKQNEWAVGSDINKINEYLKKIGTDFGLNKKRIEDFLKDEKIQDQILNERIEAQKKYQISSTPTIYLNKKKYEGKHNFDQFKKAIEKLL